MHIEIRKSGMLAVFSVLLILAMGTFVIGEKLFFGDPAALDFGTINIIPNKESGNIIQSVEIGNGQLIPGNNMIIYDTNWTFTLWGKQYTNEPIQVMIFISPDDYEVAGNSITFTEGAKERISSDFAGEINRIKEGIENAPNPDMENVDIPTEAKVDIIGG